jgi:hypothetical protein
MKTIDGILTDLKELTKRVGRLEVGPGPRVLVGTNTPEGAITAPIGTLFLRTNGGANTTLYVKESGTGNTGWIAK